MYKLFIGLLLCCFGSVSVLGQTGELDSDLDSDGILKFDAGTDTDFASDVLVQPDNKIIVVGHTTDGSTGNIIVARFNPDGTPDNTFGASGKVTVDINSQVDRVYAAALQMDGKILLAGSTGPAQGEQNLLVVRLTADGLYDPTFDIDGYVIIDPSTDFDRLHAIAIAPGGAIYVAGEVYSGGVGADFVIAKLLPNGAPDTGFSFDGVATTDFNGAEDVIYSIAVQQDGKIVAGGTTVDGLGTDFAAARYNTDGSLDNTFGTNGKTSFDIAGGQDGGNDIRLVSNGYIVMGGSSQLGGTFYNMSLARLTPSGALDVTFDGDGLYAGTLDSGDEILNKVLIQPDGKMLLCGRTTQGNNFDILLQRLNIDATTDNGFGLGSYVRQPLANNMLFTTSATLTPDGKLVVAGWATEAGADDYFVARFITGIAVGILDQGNDVVNPAVFPNPVTDSRLTIEYELTESQPLTITLMDLQGREISTLISETRNAGVQKETLNFPTVLARGYYLLQLQTESGTTAVKVLVQ